MFWFAKVGMHHFLWRAPPVPTEEEAGPILGLSESYGRSVCLVSQNARGQDRIVLSASAGASSTTMRACLAAHLPPVGCGPQ